MFPVQNGIYVPIMKKQTATCHHAAAQASRFVGIFSVLLWLMGLLLVPSTGCGKGEYEQRMNQRSSQLQRSGGSDAAEPEADPADEEF
jgi:hypothetical protein